MKKNIKFLIFLLAIFLLPVISVKAWGFVDLDGSDTPRSGYHCYYLSSDRTSSKKFVFFTNRILTGVGDLFSGENNTQTIWADRSSFPEALSSVNIESSFTDYQNGDAMSLEVCAQAAAIIMYAEAGSDYSNVPEVPIVYELPSGVPGVYDIFDEADGLHDDNTPLLLYSETGFKVFKPEPGFASSPYYDVPQGTLTPSAPDTDYLVNEGLHPGCYDSISSEQDFLECFQCSASGMVDQACRTNAYTIGILPEPETVTNVTDRIVEDDPNRVVDGTVTGIVDSEAGLYNWTCEDVKYTTAVYNILRLIAPFLLIIFASLDYFKAVVAGDIKKQQEAKVKAPKRLIAFLLLLVIPFIVSWMFKSFGGYGSNVMTAFCCVATNGNQNCSIGSSNSGTPTPTTPTNTSQVDEVTADNLCNGNNYLSPNKITTVCSVKDCINNRYGECLSTNLDDGICNKCEYTPLSISEDLCTSNCGVGYKSGQCFFNMVKGVSTSSINNLSTSGLTLIKKVHQSGTTGDYHDGYFNYDRKIKENVTQTVCTNELNGTPYDCDSSGNSCSCLYGNSIISGN